MFTFLEESSDSRSAGRTSTNKIPVELIEAMDADDDSSVSSVMESSSSKWELGSARNTEAKLRAMIRLTRHLHNAVAVEVMFAKLLDSLLRIFRQADYAVALLKEPGDETPQLTVVRYRKKTSSPEEVSISKPIVDSVLLNHQGVITDSSKESVMCAPLTDVDDRALGVIFLSASADGKRFSRDEHDLLMHVALQTSFAVETIKLHEALRRDRERQIELEMAQRIQLALLPSERPQIENYKFDDFYNPAREVGGDYYDYIHLDDGRLAIIVGDVSGKGVPAALVVASLSSLMKAYLASGLEPLDVVSRANADFMERISEERFMTLVLMVLDPNSNRLTVVNAGHLPPLLRRQDRTVLEIGEAETGLPLGVECDFPYQASFVSLGPGDSIVLYTDGITDASDSAGRLYGFDRLRLQLVGNAAGADNLRTQIMGDLMNFVNKSPQPDDMCLLCFSRNSA